MGLLLAVFIAGCGSSGDGGGTQAGVVSASLTDAPACGYDEVNVTVRKARVHQSDSANDNAAGWTDITLDPPRTINLLNLNDPTKPNFALEHLGETSLGAGHYTQLRLVLEENNGNQPSANWIVLAGQNPMTAKIPLETPSAIRSGVKLIHQFTVNSGQRVDLLLDFDACKSIVRTGSGKYILKPVIKVIPFALNGIEGFVDKQSFVNQSLIGKNVMASAQFNGEIVRATVVNTDTGKFFLSHLDPANDYDVVITADDHATAVIVGVPVSPAPSITIISTSVAPFPLQNSAFQTIDGTVTLKPDDPANDDGTVTVAAKQMLNPGPNVTVKSQVATVKTDTQATIGDYGYNLALPIGAPSRGLYGALPITLSTTSPDDQSAVAKMYTVKGSGQVGTTVFATQIPLPSSVDITVVPTQDFTLMP